MSLIEIAKKIATNAHEGQTRKYTGEPYIKHPERVAARVEKAIIGMKNEGCHFVEPEILIASAWLHDVPEDCHPKWRSEIANDCGAQVFVIIHELTNPSKGLGCKRALRKQIDREYLSCVSKDATLIKLCDRTDNLIDMLNGDDDFKLLYLSESRELLSYLKPLVEAKTVYEDYKQAMNSLSLTIPEKIPAEPDAKS